MKFYVDLIVFDFDGVIIDSARDIANAVQHVLGLFNQPILSREEIISHVGHGAENLIRRCFNGCSEDIIRQALPIYRKHYLENAVVETRLYDNVESTLKNIKTPELNKKTALVTNKPEDVARRILAVLGVGEYFDMVVGPESVTEMKPDPEGILKVLDSFEIPAQRAIMVGDSHVDIEAGKNAGAITCGVTYGMGNREELFNSAPDIIINNLASLLTILE